MRRWMKVFVLVCMASFALHFAYQCFFHGGNDPRPSLARSAKSTGAAVFVCFALPLTLAGVREFCRALRKGGELSAPAQPNGATESPRTRVSEEDPS